MAQFRAFGRSLLCVAVLASPAWHTTWDDHSDLDARLKKNCDMTDRPAAALIQDLKQRGLLDETLVIWGGEFGRTPMNEVRRGIRSVRPCSRTCPQARFPLRR